MTPDERLRHIYELSQRYERKPLGMAPLSAQIKSLFADRRLYECNPQYKRGDFGTIDTQFYCLVAIKRILLEWKWQVYSDQQPKEQYEHTRRSIAPLIQLLKAGRLQTRAAADLRQCIECALNGVDYESAYLNLVTGGSHWILGVTGTDVHETEARARLARRKSWLHSRVGCGFLRALNALLAFAHA